MNNSSQFVRNGRGLLARLARPDRPSLLPPSLSVGGVILFLTLADLITLKTLFNATFTDQPAVIWILSLVTAVLLDVPMSVAGLCVSQFAKGMRGRTGTICITAGCLAAFLLTLFLCLDMRMSTREFVLTGIGASQGGLVDLAGTGGGESVDTSGAVLSAARLLSFLPVATSIAAFAISFAFSDPRSEMIGKLESRRRALQDAIARTEAFFAECGDTEEEVLRQIRQEEELYQAFLAHVNDQVLQVRQRARILVMERAGGTPEAITHLTEGAAAAGSASPPGIRALPQTQNDWHAA